MKHAKTISRIYLILALLVAALISPLPHSLVAVLLLMPQLYSIFRPLQAGVKLALTFLALFLLPLTLEPVVGELPAVLLMVPGIPLLDSVLKENAMLRSVPGLGRVGRASTVLRILVIALLLVLFGSFIPEDRTLTWTSIVLIAYLAGVVAYILWRIPKAPLEESRTWLRIIAGDTGRIPLTLRRKRRMPLHLLLETPYPWIRLTPSQMKLGEDEAIVSMTITPPLAGPSLLQLRASVVDPWGLTQTYQMLEPVELYVIPRARYAAWLAKKYLEQVTSGAAYTAVSFPLLKRPRGIRWGVEYHSSRPYLAGDRLKDIDWKHSVKLQQLITKEHLEGPGQAAMIAANLDAEDPEQADILAYNIITSALTLAREAIPTALAVYDHKEVVAVTAAENPRQALVRTLKLAQGITLHQPGERFLGPPDLRRLRRTITQLEGAEAEPAQKLITILRTEYEALQQVARYHPATRALIEATDRTPPPALVVVISLSTDDIEALAVTLERLKKRGYDTVSMETGR